MFIRPGTYYVHDHHVSPVAGGGHNLERAMYVCDPHLGDPVSRFPIYLSPQWVYGGAGGHTNPNIGVDDPDKSKYFPATIHTTGNHHFFSCYVRWGWSNGYKYKTLTNSIPLCSLGGEGGSSQAATETSRCIPSPPIPSYQVEPDKVGAMYPALITKSPKCSASSRSRAYRLIIGRRISRISGSVTDSTIPKCIVSNVSVGHL